VNNKVENRMKRLKKGNKERRERDKKNKWLLNKEKVLVDPVLGQLHIQGKLKLLRQVRLDKASKDQWDKVMQTKVGVVNRVHLRNCLKWQEVRSKMKPTSILKNMVNWKLDK